MKFLHARSGSLVNSEHQVFFISKYFDVYSKNPQSVTPQYAHTANPHGEFRKFQNEIANHLTRTSND